MRWDADEARDEPVSESAVKLCLQDEPGGVQRAGVALTCDGVVLTHSCWRECQCGMTWMSLCKMRR